MVDTFEIIDKLVAGQVHGDVVDINRLKASGNNDIYGVLRAIADIAPLAYANDNNNQTLELLAAYPNDFVTTQSVSTEIVNQFVNTITYQIIRREPATLGDAPFQARKDWKPRYRETKLVTPTEAIEIKGQWFDNMVQFDCWTRSNKEADDLVEWFEEFMILYTFYFKKYVGVQEMFYYRGGRFTFGTTEDEAMVRWRNPFKVRSCTYYFRTEKLWFIDLGVIQKIIARLDVQDQSGTSE